MPFRRTTVRAAVLACGLALAGGSAPADEGEAPKPSALAWSNQGSLEAVTQIGQKDVTVRLHVANPTSSDVEIREANLFLAGAGGWLTALDPLTMDGTFFRGPLAVPAGGEKKFLGTFAYHPSAPASSVVLAATASDGYVAESIALLAPGAEAPPPLSVAHPFGAGIATPLEIVPFSDGRRSVIVLGQIQAPWGGRPESAKTTLLLGDGTGALEPVVMEGLGAGSDLERLWPFVRRIDVPEGFEGGLLRVRATAVLEGRPVAFEREWPVVATAPFPALGPVKGAWQLSNGPGQKDLHANYRKPEWRWSYDFVVVEQGSTYRGGPHKRESYFAWGKPVRAVAAGVVVDKCDGEVDNPGLGPSAGVAMSEAPCHVNRVVIEHEGGTRTVYLHLKQGSIPQGVQRGMRVAAGQEIGRVGNSGNSTEPHLHLVAWRFDATGRPQPVPLTFTNAYEDAAAERPLSGVPVGGRAVHFVDR